MKPFRSHLPAVVGAISLAALGVSALAQAQESAPPAAARPLKDAQGRHMHREQRVQLVHDALNLRPNQEGAWRAYRADLEAARPARPARAERPRDLTTPQRLDLMQQRMAAHQAAFARRADATKRFYAALDPAQQRTFDALSKLGGRGGRGGHHPGRGGMGHMRGPGPEAPAQG